MPKAKASRGRTTRFFPYVKGFHLPSTKHKLQAIGELGAVSEFVPDGRFFDEIPRCTSGDDWLAQYNEEGQTYTDFLQSCPWLSRRKVKYMKQVSKYDKRNH